MSNLNNPNLEPFLKAFNGEIVSKEPTESFIEKVDAEVIDKPQPKPKDSIATVAKSMKQQLE